MCSSAGAAHACHMISPPACTYATQVRERDWCNVITAHDGDTSAYTWRLQHFTLGEATLAPPAAELGGSPAAPVTAVAISSCGNFGLVGSASGRVDRYNMQSGQHRGAYRRQQAAAGAGEPWPRWQGAHMHAALRRLQQRNHPRLHLPAGHIIAATNSCCAATLCWRILCPGTWHVPPSSALAPGMCHHPLPWHLACATITHARCQHPYGPSAHSLTPLSPRWPCSSCRGPRRRRGGPGSRQQ
jgi:hypothetical protein